MGALAGLAALNCFLADVQGGLGPFLATWLAQGAQWDPARIGLVMTISGLVGLMCNAPAGALVDRSVRPRFWVAASVVATVAGTLALLPARSVAAVLGGQLAAAVGRAVTAPAIMAPTLAIVGKQPFPAQQAHNQAWNHAGNVAAAGSDLDAALDRTSLRMTVGLGGMIAVAIAILAAIIKF